MSTAKKFLIPFDPANILKGVTYASIKREARKRTYVKIENAGEYDRDGRAGHRRLAQAPRRRQQHRSGGVSMTSPVPELLTPAEAAHLLRCSSRYVQTLCAAGKIGARLIAGRYLMTQQDLNNYIDGSKVATCPSATPAPGLNGGRIGVSGKSSGTNVGNANASQRALMTAEKLLSDSRNTLRRSPPGRNAQEIPVKGL